MLEGRLSKCIEPGGEIIMKEKKYSKKVFLSFDLPWYKVILSDIKVIQTPIEESISNVKSL